MSKYEDINTISQIVAGENLLKTYYDRFFQEMLENFNLANGYIYSQADLNKLMREKRPTFQYNFFNPIIMRVLGGFKNSIIGVDFIPKNQEDMELSQVIKSINDFLLYQANNIEYEISKAFSHAIIGRIGWIKQDYIYTPEFPDGIVDIKFYNPFRIKMDINTQRRDLKDCNYISDTGWYPIEDIINIYAQNNNELQDLIIEKAKIILGESSLSTLKRQIKLWAEAFFDQFKIYSGENKGYDYSKISNLNEYLDRKDKLFKVIDWYEKRAIKTIYLIETNTKKYYDVTKIVKNENTDDIDNEKLDLLLTAYPDYKIEERFEQKIYQISIVPALNLKLYEGIHPLSNYKFVPILCYDIHPDPLEIKSIVDFIKDPIKSANHRRNTMLTYITRVAHGGWIAEESAVKDYLDEFLSNEIGGIKRVRDGSLAQGRIKQLDIPNMPTAIDKLQIEDLEFVKVISGVRDNTLGASEYANESGVLFRQKVIQSDLIQEWIADNGQQAILQISKNNLEYIQKFFTEERIIRIIDKYNNVSFLPINMKTELGVINDVSKGSYDVIISATPYGRAQKETEFNKLVTIFQLLASINPAYVDPIILIEASGIKQAQAIIQRIKAIQDQQLQTNNNINAHNVNLEKVSKIINDNQDLLANNSNY